MTNRSTVEAEAYAQQLHTDALHASFEFIALGIADYARGDKGTMAARAAYGAGLVL